MSTRQGSGCKKIPKTSETIIIDFSEWVLKRKRKQKKWRILALMCGKLVRRNIKMRCDSILWEDELTFLEKDQQKYMYL